MSLENEVERLLVRLVGDNKDYVQTLNQANQATKQFVMDANGRLRDMSGKYVSSQTLMQAQTNQSIARINAYKQALTELASRANRVGTELTKVGRAMSLRVTAPLVAAGTLGIKTFADYEASLSQLSGLVGLSAAEVSELDVAIRKMAPEVGKLPQELAEGAFFVTSAGLRGQKAIEALTDSAKASSAGLGEVRVIADAVTSAMNAYGQENMSSARATDILTAAVREGKLEASALAPVLGRLLPTASALGVEFEEVAGLMAVMSRTGANANEAVTSINAIMTTLIKPTSEAADTLDKYGLSMKQLKEMAGGEAGVLGVMRLLEKTFEGNDEELAKIVSNTRAFRGVMNVLAQDADTVQSVMDGVKDSVGATNTAFKDATNTVKFQWNQAMAEVRLALMEVGEALRPLAIEMMQKLRDVAHWFKNLSDETKWWVVVIGGIVAALGPFLIILGQLSFGIAAVVSTVKMLTTAMIALKAVMMTHPVIIAAVAVALAVKLGRALSGIDSKLKEIKRTSRGLSDVLGKRFNEGLEQISNKPIEDQIKALNRMKKASEDGLRNAERNANRLSQELDGLKSQGFIGRTLDAQGIELAEAHLKEAQERAKMYGDQIDVVNEKMKALTEQQKKVKAEAALEELLGPTRSKEGDEAFAGLLQSLTRENQNFGLEGHMRQIADLEFQLAQSGEKLTEEEKEQLVLLGKQLEAKQKLKKEQEEAEKLYDQMIRKQASDAHNLLQDQLTPIQQLKQEIADVEELMKVGALTFDQADKIIKGKISQFGEGLGSSEMFKSAGAGVSAGGKEAMIAQRQGNKADQSIEKGVWDLVDEAKLQTETEESILAELQRQTDRSHNFQVVSF